MQIYCHLCFTMQAFFSGAVCGHRAKIGLTPLVYSI